MDSNYVICNIIEIDNIDYNKIIGSKETVKYNFGQTKFIIEFQGSIPTSIQNLESDYIVQSKEQMKATLLDEEWELDDRE